MVASSFAFVNLVARPLGGYAVRPASPTASARCCIYILGIVIGFFLMAFIAKWTTGVDEDGLRNVEPDVRRPDLARHRRACITVFASIFVQGAEGATFAIIPMVNQRMTGQIAGMAGAYGNVGAVIYLVIFSLVDARTFFFILSSRCGGELPHHASSCSRNPKGAFSDTFDDEPRNSDGEAVGRGHVRDLTGPEPTSIALSPGDWTGHRHVD